MNRTILNSLIFLFQVPATPSLPQEEAMSIVELPSVQPVADQPTEEVEKPRKVDKEKGKRKLSETPSMIDPESLSKKSTRQSTTPVPTTPVPMEINENAVYERQLSPHRSKNSTPKVGRKKREGAKTPVHEVASAKHEESLVPDMTPEIQRKPPPKPKQKADEDSEANKPVKRRLSRKERNVKTPDPTFDEDHLKQMPTERPSTPRQARAPSPEERPLVVPLPPPRVQDIPLPPVRGESLERPALPPRPASAASSSKEPRDSSSPPPPPPRPAPPTQAKKDIEKVASPVPPPPHIDEVANKKEDEESRFQKQVDSTISPDKVKIETLSQPTDEVKPFEISMPSLAQAKECVRNSGLFSNSIQVSAPPTSVPAEKNVTNISVEEPKRLTDEPTSFMPTVPSKTLQEDQTSLTRQEQEEDMNEQASRKAALHNHKSKKENAVKSFKKNSEQECIEVEPKVGKKPEQESLVKENTEVHVPSENKPKGKPLENHIKNDTKNPVIAALKQSVSETATTPKVSNNDQNVTMDESSLKNDENAKALINSMPKPFKIQNIPTESVHESSKDHNIKEEEISNKTKLIPPTVEKSQSIENSQSIEKSQTPVTDKIVEPIKQPPTIVDKPATSALEVNREKDFSTSPASSSPAIQSVCNTPPLSDSPQTVPTHLRQRPEKRDNRDSKVIKAASYWNNYIGEVLDKKKVPENVKSLEKPKKIVSAGVGMKGYNNLKSAFESGKSGTVPNPKSPDPTNNSAVGPVGGIQRRNSRKIPVEGCNPGLSVLDAKSAFEQKNQQQTPVVFRRNSNVSGDNLNKGKDSDEFKSSGPNYIKKKVPDFPPPPISKTPFSRRAGAMSPPTVKARFEEEIPFQTLSNGMTEHKTFTTTEQDELNKTKPNIESSSQIENKPTKTLAPTQVSKEEQKVPIVAPVSRLDKPVQQRKDTIQNGTVQHSSLSKPIQLVQEENIIKNTPLVTKKEETCIEPKKDEIVAPIQPQEKVVKIKIKSISGDDDKKSYLSPDKTVEKPKKSEKESLPQQKIVKEKEIRELISPKLPLKQSQIQREKVKDGNESESTPVLAGKEPTPKILPSPLKNKKDSKVSSNEVSDENIVPKSNKNSDVKVAQSEGQDTKNSSGPVDENNILTRITQETTPSQKDVPKSIKIDKSYINSIPIHIQSDNLSKPAVEISESNEKDKSAPSRIIPIQIEQGNDSSQVSDVTSPIPSAASDKNNSSHEHHIPIHVEGKGTFLNRLNSTDEITEGRDSFSTNSLSRRRFGSRKKRSSFAYSDSSMTGDEDIALGDDTLSGLQKYTSIGKHGLEPMFRLKKTKPPFAAQRSDSFSSGEEDDFDDDGFKEMTAENLFSTLLTRVKSLTRRIHDEDNTDPSRYSNQNSRIVNHKLNPGSTHARLERSALRNSLKRSNNTPSALSRQSSMDASLRTSLKDDMSYGAGFEDGTSSMRSYGSSGFGDNAVGGYDRSSIQRGTKDQSETDSLYSSGSLRPEGGASSSKGKHEQQQQLQVMKRFDSDRKNADSEEVSSNVSVTSKQRLRPGYLPPPSHLVSDANSDPVSSDTRIENALSESSSMRNIGASFKKIPIEIDIDKGISSHSIASGPSQSDLMLESKREKALKDDNGKEEIKKTKRHSTVMVQDNSPVKDNSLLWSKPAEDSKKKSPYKVVQLKRLSVGLDIEDDKSLASTSSGYFSQQQNNPEIFSHQQPIRRPKEGQLTPSKTLTTLERKSTMPSTFQTASFTASNSSSIASNMNVGPSPLVPMSTAKLSTTEPKSTSNFVQEPVLDIPRFQTKLPENPSRIPPTLSPIPPPLPSSPPPLPSSPPPLLKRNIDIRTPISPTLPTSPVPKIPESSHQSSLHDSTSVISTSPLRSDPGGFLSSNTSPTVLKQPIYSPFKVCQQAAPPGASSTDQSSQSAKNTSNPFQKQARNQPFRPYLQIALVQDRQYKSQTQALAKDGGGHSGDGPSDDNTRGPITTNRRTILPYGGAKSDGQLNKHAFISCNVIAAAERRKRDSYSRSSTTELPLEKVIDHLVDFPFLPCCSLFQYPLFSKSHMIK